MTSEPLNVSITANGRCHVTRPRTGRIFSSTPRAVALALIGSEPPEESEAARSFGWIDLLATHGTLFGRQGQREVTAVLIPRKERDVILYPDVRMKVSYPPTLLGLLTESGRMVRGMVMCADASRQAQMSVLATAPLLVPFPYGNIYRENGLICWGTVAHGDIRSIHDLESLFFSSGFNHDLFSSSVAGVSGLRAGALPDIGQAAFSTTFPTFIGRLIGR